LYNILTDFVMPMKQVRLIKVCLNETYSKVRIGIYLSDNVSLQNDLKQEDASYGLLLNFTSIMPSGTLRKTRWG
jgi:hypothetical protein